MHRIEVSVPRVDSGQHVFANPAARIRQGFEHVRPSKEEAALPFEQVARVQAEGWMFLLATARQLGVHTIIWEWDGAKAVELSNVGVVRKPGSILAWQGSGGKLTLTMTDGKVTGCSGSGRGVNTLATGDWAKLAGKGYTWTAKCVGPASQYTVEAKDE